MTDPDGLTALLLQITSQAERLAALDQRQAADTTDLRDKLIALTRAAEAIKGTIADQGEILAGLNGLDIAVTALTARLDAIAPDGTEPDGYQPVPAPAFWKLTGSDREAAVDRLRAWVEQIYRPGYGALAAVLGDCWDQHPLCLYGLDWLSELWSLLYLAATRTPGALAGQAEWQTRLLPALAGQMARETSTCVHAAARDDSAGTGPPGRRPARPAPAGYRTVNRNAGESDD